MSGHPNMEKTKIELLLEKLDLRSNQLDVKKLNENIDVLQQWNLSKLSDRLLCSTKPSKFLETLTELNFTTQLIKSFPFNTITSIEYEPEDSKRPIDLVVTLNTTKYFIQIKSLSNSIRENKQSKIIREIRKQIKNISCNRGIMIHASEGFSKDHVSELMIFIKDNIDKKDGEKLMFLDGNNVIAEIEFQTSAKSFREHLALYSFGDLEAVNVTGMTKDQVKKALEKAAGAFEINSSEQTINLIVSEIRSDRSQAIDFAEALYGTEYCTFHNGKMLTHRDNDGLFLEENFAKKIAGIIVLHKREATLSSQYDRAICCNPLHDYLRPITDLIHERIIERFTWIDGSLF